MDLNTKYGKVRIDKKGYYRIITSKEGNGNKLDNCILNLQLIRHDKHASIHHKHKKVSCETIEKLVKSKTKDYTRIVKNGMKGNKQNYCIISDGVKIKRSVDKEKLLDWFLKEYPLEIIKVGA